MEGIYSNARLSSYQTTTCFTPRHRSDTSAFPSSYSFFVIANFSYVQINSKNKVDCAISGDRDLSGHFKWLGLSVNQPAGWERLCKYASEDQEVKEQR